MDANPQVARLPGKDLQLLLDRQQDELVELGDELCRAHFVGILERTLKAEGVHMRVVGVKQCARFEPVGQPGVDPGAVVVGNVLIGTVRDLRG